MVEIPQHIREKYLVKAHGPGNSSQPPLVGEVADQVKALREEIALYKKPPKGREFPTNLYENDAWHLL